MGDLIAIVALSLFCWGICWAAIVFLGGIFGVQEKYYIYYVTNSLKMHKTPVEIRRLNLIDCIESKKIILTPSHYDAVFIKNKKLS